MALSFYFQVILSCLVFTVGPWDLTPKYWIGTAHPLFRLPVFFMGVCAGVLCNRIQQGDLDAFHSKFEFHKDQNLIPSWNQLAKKNVFLNNHRFLQGLVDGPTMVFYHLLKIHIFHFHFVNRLMKAVL